jgi:DNA-binding NarL/FixJ family response regulator
VRATYARRARSDPASQARDDGASLATSSCMGRAGVYIAIVSEHTLLREGLAQLLRAKGFHHVTHSRALDDAPRRARRDGPSILMIDLDHQSHDTLATLHAARRAFPETTIVVIGTALRQAAVALAATPGVETPNADGSALAATIAAAATGTSPPGSRELHSNQRLYARLTSRQRDVLRCLSSGADNRTIARQLRVGERAVKAHVSTLLATLGVDNRAQLALLADRAGMRAP